MLYNFRHGAIGLTTTLEGYRRRGFAKTLTVTLIKELRLRGLNAYLHINLNNHASLTMHQKLGFKKVVDKVHIQFYTP